MINSIIQEIAGGENRYCDNFKMLETDEQLHMIANCIRSNDIEVTTIATQALIEGNLLADCLDALGLCNTSAEARLCQATFFVELVIKMADKMQDCIDEYNEQVEATKNEPARPLSDYQ